MRRTLTPGELALLLGGGQWHFRTEMRRPDDAAWTNLSNVSGGDWVTLVRLERETVDQPVSRFTVELLKRADGASLSPGVSGSALNQDAADAFRPIVYAGNPVRVYAALTARGATPLAGDWRLWLEGETDTVEWPGDGVRAVCDSLDAIVENAWIKEVEERGAEYPGVPLDEEIQGLLDRWEGTISLRVEGDDPALEAGVGLYETAEGSLGEALRTLAQRTGRDLRYLWSEEDGAFRYTLYQPPRDKTSVDLALSASDVFDVPELRVSRQYVRNDFTGVAVDPETGKQIVRTLENAASIAQFRRRPMKITQGKDSPIKSAAALDVLLSYADHDLAQPPTEARKRIPFVPWLGIHDRLSIAADGENFDYTTEWSIVGITHVVDGSQGAYTEVDLRGGSPVGMYYSWYKFEGRTGGEEGLVAILSIDEVAKTDKYTDLLPNATPATAGVQVFDLLFDLNFSGSTLPTKSSRIAAELEPGETYRAQVPPEGKKRFVYFVPRSSTGVAGDMRRFEMGPAVASTPWFEWVDASQVGGGNAVNLSCRFRDPQGLGGTLRVWSNPADPADPDRAGAPDGELEVASTPATVTAADMPALAGVVVHPSRGKRVFLEFVNADGISSGQRPESIHGYTTAVTFDDTLRPAIVDALALADKAVERAKLQLEAVAEQQLADLAVARAKIQLLAVAEQQLADLAVARSKIQAQAVAEQQLADLAVSQAKIQLRAIGDQQLKLSGVARENIVRGAVDAALLDDNILDLTNFNRVVLNNAIAAGKLAVNELSEIAPGAGILLYGELRNAAGTRYMKIDATGTQSFLQFDDKFSLRADGTVLFGGALVAATGTFAGSLTAATGTFAGSLTAATGSFAGSLSAATGTFSGSLSAAGGSFTGTLTSVGGTFTGELLAATGTFTGALVAASGSFTGSLSAVSGTFTGSLVSAGGTFTGTLSGVNGTFTGTLTAGATSATPLSALNANLGEITAGKLRNAANTMGIGLGDASVGGWARYISFYGADYFIKHEKFTLDHAGNASYSGALAAATGTFSGSLSAATGTFAGSLSAATGLFKGKLELDVGAGAFIEFYRSGGYVGKIEGRGPADSPFGGSEIVIQNNSGAYAVMAEDTFYSSAGFRTNGGLTLIGTGLTWDIKSEFVGGSGRLSMYYSGTLRYYFRSDGTAFSDVGWSTFSPVPPKPHDAMIAADWIKWARSESMKPVKPYHGLPTEDHPEVRALAKAERRSAAAVVDREIDRYSKNIAQIAIGASNGLGSMYDAARKAGSFDEWKELIGA